jgi:hypothetical protein
MNLNDAYMIVVLIFENHVENEPTLIHLYEVY